MSGIGIGSRNLTAQCGPNASDNSMDNKPLIFIDTPRLERATRPPASKHMPHHHFLIHHTETCSTTTTTEAAEAKRLALALVRLAGAAVGPVSADAFARIPPGMGAPLAAAALVEAAVGVVGNGVDGLSSRCHR